MKRILIADASKASLVMTSEVFKDHFPGVQVVVARTSADAIELAKTAGELDAFIIDYDLPDRDGAFTAARLKKMFSQPILITAFDRPDVQESIDRDLSAFDDCLSWLKKPVKPELVVSLAQRFIEGQHRCQRRLNCSLPAFLEVEFLAAPQHSGAGRGFDVVRHQQVARVKVVAKKKVKAKTGSSTAQKTKAKPQKATAAKKTTTQQKAGSKTATKSVAPEKDVKKTVGKSQGKSAPVKAQSGKSAVNKVTSKPAKTVSKKVEPAIVVAPVRKMIPVTIDDVSLGGAKIRISNRDLMINNPLAGKGKSVQMFCDFREGQILSVCVPPGNIIEAGADALEKWQKAQSKTLLGGGSKSVTQANEKSKNSTGKSSTLGGLVSVGRTTAKKSETEEGAEAAQSNCGVLRGEVRWTASNETFTFCGLRSEAVNVSKKIFESLIEIEMRLRSQLSPMVSPNVPRAPKLNA